MTLPLQGPGLVPTPPAASLGHVSEEDEARASCPHAAASTDAMHLPHLINYIKKKPTKANVIIGIGTGRCGTTALASLLDSQRDILCFHEMNPSSMSWEGAEATVTSTLRDFDAILRGKELGVTIDLTSQNRASPLKAAREKVRITAIGDVASYYLPYVKHILDRQPKAKLPCMTRCKEEVVRSFSENFPLKLTVNRGITGRCTRTRSGSPTLSGTGASRAMTWMKARALRITSQSTSMTTMVRLGDLWMNSRTT